MLKKLACFTGWVVVISLLLIFCITIGLWQNWSTPAIFLLWVWMIILSLFLWCFFYAVAEMIKKNQGRRWLEKYRPSRRENVLLNHWKRGASVLKKMKFKRRKLPWFLLVGDTCGKSTLLAGAGIPNFNGQDEDAVVRPTRTLKWWFFQHVCILELSSKFIHGSVIFRKAWARMGRWCAHMPAPAGIIVAMPVSAIMSDDLSALHTMMRQQRSLIEPLVRRFGKSVPLYVIITQCDDFPGFSLWHQQLSATQRQQWLGYCWQEPQEIDGQDEYALRPLFAALEQGMSQVRLSMYSSDMVSSSDRAALMDFPESFASLDSKLRYALASLCEPNAYFSNAFLKGVCFSSAEPQTDNCRHLNSIFTHDLLTRHLPHLGRHGEGISWYQQPLGKRVSTGLLSVFMLWLAVSAGLSFKRLQPEMSTLAPDSLVSFLSQEEGYSTTSFLYLPFQFLLGKQLQYAEDQLAKLVSIPQESDVVLSEFRHRFLTASPGQQRELILQLSQGIQTWQQMRNGDSLSTLSQKPLVPVLLQQRAYPKAFSTWIKLALERYYIQKPAGASWLLSSRNMLAELVNQEPSASWLTAPVEQLSARQAKMFWPSLPDTIALSGIWTHEGEKARSNWMSEIERAAGRPLPVLQHIRDQDAMRRQDAWKQYLIDITSALSSEAPVTLSQRDLLDVGQNQSQAMQFASYVLHDLNDIPSTEAQPWLTTLRQLQKLETHAKMSEWVGKAEQLNNRARLSLTGWLRGGSQASIADNIQSEDRVWHQWQATRNGAIKDALSEGQPDSQLTRGLFNPLQNARDTNPLTELLPELTALQELISPHSTDLGVAAVWQLYQYDARSLLGNAMAQSACWLNKQWQSQVIEPLNKDSEQQSYDDQNAQSQQAVSAFLMGPAKALLTVGRNGLSAAEYAGMKVPLTTDFTHFLQDDVDPDKIKDFPLRSSTRVQDRRARLQAQLEQLEQKQNGLEKKSWNVSVASLPATIPGGAPVIPIGTRLTLNCTHGDQQLSSMNFEDKHNFIWTPGQCPGVTLSVIFPDFTANYQLHGDDAWPFFVNRFTDEDVLLNSREFSDDSAPLLLASGIKHVLVRFTVSNPQGLETAWQSWSDLTDKINTITAHIANIDDESKVNTFNPMSSLPDAIALCR